MLKQSRTAKWMCICLSLALIAGQIFMVPAFAFDESCARELKEMDIIKGDQNGNLQTDKTITRLEMSVLLSKIYGESDAAKGYSGVSDYKDAEKIAGWGKKYADFAKKNGWMVGDNKGNFDPNGLITGEQLAVILLKNLGYETGKWGSNRELFKEKTGVAIDSDTAMKRGEIFEVLYQAVYEKETGLSSSGRKASVLETAGKVSVKRAVSPKYIPAFIKMKVEGGDQIATERSSWVTLNFDDNKKVKLAGSTTATVDELVKTKNSTSTVFVLEKGGIGTETDGKLEPGFEYKIKTPTAILGIRGTEFYVQVEENETEVWLAKGSVEIAYKVEGGKIKNISGAGTEKTMLIDASGKPVKITIPKEETEIKDGKLETEIFKLDGLYEEFLISPTFPELGFTKEEIDKAIEKDREKRGTVDSNNNNTNNDNSLNNNDVSPFKDETTGLYGLRDKDGKVILAPKYKFIFKFSEGLAMVEEDGKNGYIDKTGKVVIPFIYDGGDHFSEGLAKVVKDEKYGYIDKTGKVVVPIIFDFLLRFSEGLAWVEKDEKHGYIDKTGKVVVPLIYDGASHFSEGLACAKKDGKYGYIDKTGKVVIPFIYDGASHFSEGLADVKKDGKYGYIDKTGKVEIPFIYDIVGSFSEGMAKVTKQHFKYGYIDKTGREVIPLIYDFAFTFKEGLAGVDKNGKCGFIDQKGREVIPFIYDVVYVFTEGLALVKKDGKYGYIDKTGKVVIPLIYDSASSFSYNKLASVQKDGETFYIDKQGNRID